MGIVSWVSDERVRENKNALNEHELRLLSIAVLYRGVGLPVAKRITRVIEEKTMSLRQKAFAAGLAAMLAASLLGGTALGAKKITYAEAYRLCKAEVDSSGAHAHWVSNERYHRGSACMHKYGFRL